MRENLPEVLPEFPSHVIPKRKARTKYVEVAPPGPIALRLRAAERHMRKYGFSNNFFANYKEAVGLRPNFMPYANQPEIEKSPAFPALKALATFVIDQGFGPFSSARPEVSAVCRWNNSGTQTRENVASTMERVAAQLETA